MKINEKTITVEKHITTYIASDGTEFDSRWACESYEQRLPLKGEKVIDTAINDLNDFFTENPMTLYKIKNEEDWNLLVERVWFYRQGVPEYPGPGLYVAIKEYGGDHGDTYTIYEYDTYRSLIDHYYDDYCRETNKWYNQMFDNE